MFPTTRRFAFSAVLAASALTASSASAATLTLSRACYAYDSSAEVPIEATASGLAANTFHSLRLSSTETLGPSGSTSGTSDASGNLGLTISSYFGGSSSKIQSNDASVALTDLNGTVVATATTKTAPVAADVTGSGKYRNWKVSGLSTLTGGTTYYAHYFNNNKYKGRLKIGKASGPCGIYKGKRPLTPFSKLGRYDVKITTTKHWAAGDQFIAGRIVVTKRYS
ncbi:MAG: hypothetical protein QM679_08000 [Patulibacter sp.]